MKCLVVFFVQPFLTPVPLTEHGLGSCPVFKHRKQSLSVFVFSTLSYAVVLLESGQFQNFVFSIDQKTYGISRKILFLNIRCESSSTLLVTARMTIFFRPFLNCVIKLSWTLVVSSIRAVRTCIALKFEPYLWKLVNYLALRFLGYYSTASFGTESDSRSLSCPYSVKTLTEPVTMGENLMISNVSWGLMRWCDWIFLPLAFTTASGLQKPPSSVCQATLYKVPLYPLTSIAALVSAVRWIFKYIILTLSSA